MRQKIDFTAQEKEAEREFMRNKNAVVGRMKKRKKRITGQVRMSELLRRQLKLYAAQEGRTMSYLLDKIVGQFLKK